MFWYAAFFSVLSKLASEHNCRHAQKPVYWYWRGKNIQYTICYDVIWEGNVEIKQKIIQGTVIHLHESMMSRAFCFPTKLTNLLAPPQPGATPIRACTNAMEDFSDTSLKTEIFFGLISIVWSCHHLKSVEVVISAPPPTANPFFSYIDYLIKLLMIELGNLCTKNTWRNVADIKGSLPSLSVASFIHMDIIKPASGLLIWLTVLRSPPEQKAFEALSAPLIIGLASFFATVF